MLSQVGPPRVALTRLNVNNCHPKNSQPAIAPTRALVTTVEIEGPEYVTVVR